jgi:hypothetical protein
VSEGLRAIAAKGVADGYERDVVVVGPVGGVAERLLGVVGSGAAATSTGGQADPGAPAGGRGGQDRDLVGLTEARSSGSPASVDDTLHRHFGLPDTHP